MNSMNSGTLASEALPLTSSLGMMISPRMVMVVSSSGVKNVLLASSRICPISSGMRLKPLGFSAFSAPSAVLSAPEVAGFLSPVLQASARAPAETVVIRRVLMLFLLSIFVVLDITFFHFIYDVFAGAHRQGQDGPGNVLVGL